VEIIGFESALPRESYQEKEKDTKICKSQNMVTSNYIKPKKSCNGSALKSTRELKKN